MNTQNVRIFPEIGFAVIFDRQGLFVEFKGYEIEGEGHDGTVFFHRDGSRIRPDVVESIGQAEIYFSGSVRWDGCSNWKFDEQERVMLHGCSRADLIHLGEALAACWDVAKELLGADWDGG